MQHNFFSDLQIDATLCLSFFQKIDVFPLMAIKNKAAMKIYIKFFVWTYVILGKDKGVKLISQMIRICLTL